MTRFTRDFCDENVQPTLGVEFMAGIIQTEKSRIELQPWDPAGQELFRSVTRGYYRGSVGGYLVFDLTQQSTFDLSERRQVSKAEIESFAKKHNIEFFFETSAKTDESINEAICSFLHLIEEKVSSFDN
ncbi:Ras- protein Rab-4A [Tritrichomonas musculus]|uniref:Ras- protein Rab-4A n=1 Tax=Tritrichomonas musculus TaxID=1915356 RepID=A0ABR2JEI8_9EUKA